MGNKSSSTGARRKSVSVYQIDYRDRNRLQEDFNKSKSMNALGSKSKSHASLKKTESGLKRTDTKNGSSAALNRTKSQMKRDASHPISPQGREIIRECFENPHSEFGNKVCQRVFEKRPDYQKYVYTLGKEKSFAITVKLKDLIESVVAKIHDCEYIADISRAYGEEHVELKAAGFKPDFWVSMADAITVEGVILDMANHQPADTVSAWSQLVSLMFSSVRDGYYTALRQNRLNSRRGVRRQTTVDSTGGVSTDQADDSPEGEPSPIGGASTSSISRRTHGSVSSQTSSAQRSKRGSLENTQSPSITQVSTPVSQKRTNILEQSTSSRYCQPVSAGGEPAMRRPIFE